MAGVGTRGPFLVIDYGVLFSFFFSFCLDGAGGVGTGFATTLQ